MRIREIVLLAGLVLVTGAGAMAQDGKPKPFDEKAFPSEVRKALRYAHEECKRADGGKVTFAPDTVRVRDLTGDGRDDYIVSLEDTQCSSFESVFCGTGGCTLDIIVTLPSGKHRNVFSRRVLMYEILPGEAAKTIRFALHGSYCGKGGMDECRKEQTITARPFDYRQPK